MARLTTPKTTLPRLRKAAMTPAPLADRRPPSIGRPFPLRSSATMSKIIVAPPNVGLRGATDLRSPSRGSRTGQRVVPLGTGRCTSPCGRPSSP